MTAFAPVLQAFFTDRLIAQRGASPHTIAGYRDTFRLLLGFASNRTGKQPSSLDIADLDAGLVVAFLDHLEHERHNTVRTRNWRLAAILIQPGRRERTSAPWALQDDEQAVRAGVERALVQEVVADGREEPGRNRDGALVASICRARNYVAWVRVWLASRSVMSGLWDSRRCGR